MQLRRNFINKVGRGRDIYTMLVSTATGTGLNLSTGNRVGMCCLDRSSTDWFICTVTAGTGTWVKLNA